MNPPLLSTEIPGLAPFVRGKVRDIYEFPSERLLIVATDRISAFDVVMPNGIPEKGKILTQLSAFWFEKTEGIVSSHLITANINEIEELKLDNHLKKMLDGRTMLVKKASRIDVECVVRGYLSGSAWSEYKNSGTICGEKIKNNSLKESEKLSEPLFTPATKSETGHDENISFARMADKIGREKAEILKTKSIEIYMFAEHYAKERGIIIADTKMEFGILDNEIILIDELLTPDSSRFWDIEDYEVGKSQPSFDKQYVRDYLIFIGWNKEPPAPVLPPEVVEKTKEKYREAYRRFTGKTR
ncbi:MAG: phosphoribosylaminoimidazolesuccinocarboxamide synthase [Candidatus Edwardsbacteria bacterium]